MDARENRFAFRACVGGQEVACNGTWEAIDGGPEAEGTRWRVFQVHDCEGGGQVALDQDQFAEIALLLVRRDAVHGSSGNIDEVVYADPRSERLKTLTFAPGNGPAQHVISTVTKPYGRTALRRARTLKSWVILAVVFAAVLGLMVLVNLALG